jgi:hypothetical protein
MRRRRCRRRSGWWSCGARVPRYQREMLRELARREGTPVDAILTRELEDVACAYGNELEASMPELGIALAWPG